MITYHNAVDFLTSKIPEFTPGELLLDYPTLLYGEFAVFVFQKMLADDRSVISRSLEVINELSSSDDNQVLAILSEFVLTLYDTNKEKYEEFKSKLPPVAANRFDENIALWLRKR